MSTPSDFLNPKIIRNMQTTPFLSIMFAVESFKMRIKNSKELVLHQENGEKQVLFLYNFPKSPEQYPSYIAVLLFTPSFFTTKEGGFRRSFIYKTLSLFYNREKKIPKVRSRVFGILWTNSLTEMDSVYSGRISDLKLWNTATEIQKERNRILQFLKWAIKIPARQQKNLNWSLLQDIFSEYVKDVSVPLSTLQLNFQSIVKKHLK